MKRSWAELEQALARQEAAMAERAAALASGAQSAEVFTATLAPMAHEIGQLKQQLRERMPRRKLHAHRRELNALLVQASADDRRRYEWERDQIDGALRQRGRAGANRLLVFAFALFGALALALAVLPSLLGPP